MPGHTQYQVIDIYRELISFVFEVDIYVPWANLIEVKQEYGINILTAFPGENDYKAIVLVVAHKEFHNLNLKSSYVKDCVIYDAKAMFERQLADGRL